MVGGETLIFVSVIASSNSTGGALLLLLLFTVYCLLCNLGRRTLPGPARDLREWHKHYVIVVAVVVAPA